MTFRSRGGRLLREPLVHFAVLGALVFALFGNATSADERRIVIDAARVERIAGQYAQNFRRAPSAEELDALIRDDVKEEVYYREALRLGLDRDDEVVRRRMRVKMEAFGDTAEDIAAPDDATLQRWLVTTPIGSREKPFTLSTSAIWAATRVAHKPASRNCAAGVTMQERPSPSPRSSRRSARAKRQSCSATILPPRWIVCRWGSGAGRWRPALASIWCGCASGIQPPRRVSPQSASGSRTIGARQWPATAPNAPIAPCLGATTW